jgi:hypothetical protein
MVVFEPLNQALFSAAIYSLNFGYKPVKFLDPSLKYLIQLSKTLLKASNLND